MVDEVTGGVGAHVVYDGVGQATFDDSLAALRPRGMLVVYGAASGQVPPFDIQRLNSGGSLFATRPTLAHYVADVEELRWRAREVFDWIAGGELDVRIGGRYPLADAARAQQDLAARRTTGKLLLIPLGWVCGKDRVGCGERHCPRARTMVRSAKGLFSLADRFSC